MIPRKLKILGLAGALAFIAVLIFFISRKKFLDPDELETLYASWLMFKGKMVYRDFYQIHTPLAYFLFSPIFLFFKSLKVIAACRALVFVLIFFNGFLLFKIARRLFNAKTAVASLFFYLTSWPVFYKMIEIRPDIFVAIFVNLSLIALLAKSGNAPGFFILTGALCGLAFLTKQSGAIFFLALMLFFVLSPAVTRRCSPHDGIFSPKRFNIKTFLGLIVGFWAVLAIFFLFLRMNKAAGCFIAYSVKNDFLHKFLFLRIQAVHWLPFKFIKESFMFNPLIYICAVSSALVFMIPSDRRRMPGAYVFILSLALVCFASLFLILHPWAQEFILPEQYLAILAGAGLIKLLEHIRSPGLKTAQRRIYSVVIAGCIAAGGWIFLSGVRAESRLAWIDSERSLEKILALTGENDKCISLRFPCLFRPSAYFYRVGSNLMESPSGREKIGNALISDIERGDIKIILWSYQLDKMPDLAARIKQSYIPRTENIFIPGAQVDLSDGLVKYIDILVEGRYRISVGNPRGIIGWQGLSENPVYLKRGRYPLVGSSRIGKVRLSYDFGAR